MVIEGKKTMCAYTHLCIPTNSLFVNGSFAWLVDIKSVRTTVLTFEMTEKNTAYDKTREGSWMSMKWR